MRIVVEGLKRNRLIVVLWLVFMTVAFVIFRLYNIILEPFCYAAVITFCILLFFFILDCIREGKDAVQRAAALTSTEFMWKTLPPAQTVAEEDYQTMIRNLGSRLESLAAEYDAREQDSLDYYTAWVHQIKTPIAVMKLKLADDTPQNRELSEELFRIEQYVDMALQYIRLDSTTTDLVIREYQLDDLIKESIHKYAAQFIGKKVGLDYEPSGRVIVTDRKWFSCIVDQLISNAVKYTPSGKVSVRVSDNCLVISDTGIGIAPEDLPRIFEKGYTGLNGRIGEKSSGLGLYLANKAANLLRLTITVDSRVGEGSSFSIGIVRENGD